MSQTSPSTCAQFPPRPLPTIRFWFGRDPTTRKIVTISLRGRAELRPLITVHKLEINRYTSDGAAVLVRKQSYPKSCFGSYHLYYPVDPNSHQWDGYFLHNYHRLAAASGGPASPSDWQLSRIRDHDVYEGGATWGHGTCRKHAPFLDRLLGRCSRC